MRRSFTVLAAILAVAATGCSDRTTAAGNGDGGTVADAPYVVDDAGNIVRDDAGNPIPVPQDAGQLDSPVAPPEDGPPAQEDSGATPGVIPCGNSATCDATTEQCCVTQSGATCIGVSDTCQGLTVSCDGPEDCASGEPVCCARVMGGGDRGVVCTAADQCQGYVLCRVDGDCPSGNKCCGSGRLGNITATWCQAEATCPDTTPTTGVPCGTATCTSPEVCCRTLTGQSCAAADACQGMILSCDGPEDCSGTTPTCCGHLGTSGSGTECVAADDCTSSGYTSGVVCHDDGDCPDNGTCTTLPLVAVRICR